MTGIAGVVRVVAVRAGRWRRLHLMRFVPALGLSWFVWTILRDLIGASPDLYIAWVAEVAQAIIALVAAYAGVFCLAAGGDLTGPAQHNPIALTSLSGLAPAGYVAGVWIGRLGVVTVRTLAAVPFLAALSLFGAIDATILVRGALAVLLVMALVTALALVVSPFAGNRVAGVALTLAAVTAAIILPAVVIVVVLDAATATRALDTAVRLLPFGLLEPGHPVLPPVACSATLTGALLILASWHLRRRLVVARQSASKSRARAVRVGRGRESTLASPQSQSLRPQRPPPASLAELGQRGNRRMLRVTTVCWLIAAALAGLFLTRIYDQASSFSHRHYAPASEPQRLLLTGMVYLTAFLFVIGVHGFWARLERGGLLPVLLSGPQSPRAYLWGSIRTGSTMAVGPLLFTVWLMTTYSIAEDIDPKSLGDPGFGIFASLALLAATSTLEAIGASHGRGHRRLELLAMVCVGPIVIDLLLDSVHRLGEVGMLLLAVTVALGLGPPLFFAGRPRYDPRAGTRVVVASIGLALPLLVGLAVGDLIPRPSLSPAISLGESLAEVTRRPWFEFYRGIHAPDPASLFFSTAQLTAAGFLLWWALREFDAITRRAPPEGPTTWR